jgi:UDP-N-acetyl-D-glucosamine dehydrogenase
LSLQFARSDVEVLGLDIDPAKVQSINCGQSYIKHIESASIAEQLSAKRFAASTDFSRIKEVQAVIICVPTPLNKNREPDISYVLSTGAAIAPHVTKGMLVVLESTTYPGTTDEDLRAVLERGSGLRAGEDFHLAFSPEREDPGNPDQGSHDTKVVGRLHANLLGESQGLYSRAIKTIVRSPRAALPKPLNYSRISFAA